MAAPAGRRHRSRATLRMRRIVLHAVTMVKWLAAAAAGWSGPVVRQTYEGRFASFEVNGVRMQPSWLLPLRKNDTAFDAEVLGAASAGVRLFTIMVELTDGVLRPDDTAVATAGRIVELVPDALLILRVCTGKMLHTTASAMVLRARNGSAMTAGSHGAVDAWTDQWVATASDRLATLLRDADGLFPRRVFGVWLQSGTSGEWNYPVDATYSFFPDYNNITVAGFCKTKRRKATAHGDNVGDSPGDAGPSGCTAPTVADRDTPTLGNLFLTADTAAQGDAVAFNAYLNGCVRAAIANLSAVVKCVSGGRAWVGAFGGYLYNSANVMPFSGHVGLGDLLRVPTLDAVGTPYLYFNASQDPWWGVGVPQGPWDSAALHGKMWVVEDDQRTLFTERVKRTPFQYCHTMAETLAKLRRNHLRTAIHGAGQYLFDLSGGHYADPAHPAQTRELWRGIAALRDEAASASRLAAASVLGSGRAAALPPLKPVGGAGKQGGADHGWAHSNDKGTGGSDREQLRAPGGVVAEVAVFTDDHSALRWRLASGVHRGTEDQHPDPSVHWPGSDPLSWNQDVLIDPVLSLAAAGWPMRLHMQDDLLLPPCRGPSPAPGCFPSAGLRLAVFANAHVVPPGVRDGVRAHLEANNVTTVWLYAAAVVNATTGRASALDAAADVTGMPQLRRGAGGPTPQNFTVTAAGTAKAGVSGWFGAGKAVDPWFYIDDAGGDVDVLARYSGGVGSGLAAVGSTAAAGGNDRRVVFSSAPTLPSQVWRAVARDAGVHAYADGGRDAVIDGAGAVLYVAFTRAHWSPWTYRGLRSAQGASGDAVPDDAPCVVTLPGPARKVAVLVAAGSVVCTDCARWQLPCNASTLYHISF